MSTEQEDWVLTALTPGIGPVAMLRLIETFGTISCARRASDAALQPILGNKVSQALRQEVAAEACAAALDWAKRPGAFLLTLNAADYPQALAETYSPPPLLFGLGRRELLQQPMLAIVGSRRAFEPACATTREFAASLAQQGYTIVSGLASGIDSAAHSGALPYPASTVAVIGTGIDRVYPASNRDLARRLAQEGLILSEFPLGAGPLAQHFPQRNRIIAGLARACLVVEAGIESGSLITARLAAEAGREVMAIPGSIHNPQARGCHHLIKQGAKLVETIDDILNEIGTLDGSRRLPDSVRTGQQNTQVLTDAMGFEAQTIDQLATKLELTTAELYAMLLQLELEGRVAHLPGGRFQRLEF